MSNGEFSHGKIYFSRVADCEWAHRRVQRAVVHYRRCHRHPTFLRSTSPSLLFPIAHDFHISWANNCARFPHFVWCSHTERGTYFFSADKSPSLGRRFRYQHLLIIYIGVPLVLTLREIGRCLDGGQMRTEQIRFIWMIFLLKIISSDVKKSKQSILK